MSETISVRARQMADHAIGCIHRRSTHNRDGCYNCSRSDSLADNAERLAREFAIDALRVVLNARDLYPRFAFESLQHAEAWAEKTITAAIERAERGTET